MDYPNWKLTYGIPEIHETFINKPKMLYCFFNNKKSIKQMINLLYCFDDNYNYQAFSQ